MLLTFGRFPLPPDYLPQVANQDHSLMQGVEAVENILSLGSDEVAFEETLFNPRHVF